MNLRDLRYLVAVAEQRHFGRAAELCHVSQPTLSAQLKKLEAELGVTLLERTNKSVAVTPLGAAVVQRARAALEQADAILEVARAGRDPMAGPLILGVIPTLGPYLLPWILAPIGRRFPALELVLREDLTDRLVKQLRAHEIDAALLALPVTDPELAALPLFEEPFWVAFPPGHRFAGQARIAEKDLRAEDLLLLAEGHCLRDQALSVCGQRGTAPADRIGNLQATSLETLRQMVAAGYGCTLLPALALQAPRAQRSPVDAKQLRAAAASRRIAIVHRRSFPRVAGLEQLATFIREKLPSSVRAID
ncbi:MAG: LysR substrate-binding domain-containing protein [Kiloniellales bacterium]|nr:LysR substrate-binding domain-containing protein [Kiloniellales bacterium]